MYSSIPLDNKIYPSSFVQDYLNKTPDMAAFLDIEFSKTDFEKQIENKSFDNNSRQLLYDRLSFQYEKANINEPSCLESILDTNTYTVTTGHQLCLFGGPQYFIHKIISTIKLAEVLKEQHSDKDFIPVFWMASEDHDFEEISSATIYNHRINIKGDHKNGVGRLKTTLFAEALDELKSIFKTDSRGEELMAVFSEAFKRDNWADATRYWVHHFFTDYNLLIIDGDDNELKKTMIPIFKKEIKDGISAHQVKATNIELEKAGYPIQVQSRPVNLFCFDEEQRHRIIPEGDLFLIGSKKYSYNELIKKIELDPASFSPNVLLRPVYQELILPNLAYVGGPAEITYWSQLKTLFRSFDVQFPKVFLRESFAWLSSKEFSWWNEQGLSLDDLFIPYDLLVKKIIDKKKIKIDLSHEYQLLDQMKKSLFDKAQKLDIDLTNYFASELKKIDNILLKTEKKILQHVKKRESHYLSKIKKIRERISIENKLSERTDNFIPIYTALKDDYVKDLLANADPLNPTLKLLVY